MEDLEWKTAEKGGRLPSEEAEVATEWNSCLRSDVEDVAERGPSREENSNDVKGEEVSQVDLSRTVLATAPRKPPPRMGSATTVIGYHV